MRNLFLIAKREYLERVRSRSFLIMTILIPALMGGALVIPTLLANRGSGEAKHLVVVVSDQATGQVIREGLQALGNGAKEQSAAEKLSNGREQFSAPRLSVDIDTNATDSERASLTTQIQQKKLDGMIWATQDALKAKKIDFVTRDVSSVIDNALIGQGLDEAVRRQTLKTKGMSSAEIESALAHVDLVSKSPYGVGAPDPQKQLLVVIFMVMVMYMTVMLYGLGVMRATLEEKTSRIMEVMLSTATSKDMMAGKILGVGAAGLTQIGIWFAAGVIFSVGPLAALAGMVKGLIAPATLVYFVIFYVLGFSLYSTLCAALGSMVNSEQETQQLQFVVMMPMIISIMIVFQVMQHPDSSLAMWASMFPFTAPLIMFARIAILHTVPWPQIAVSIGLLVVTIYAMVLLAARIYRVGILMYGKKPTLPEILKWIRYA